MSGLIGTSADRPDVRPGASESPAGSRIAGLDGLRGVAVLAVLLFHTGAAPLEGGFLGVDVFFVLSGFLIGGLLVDELSRRGGIALGSFWLRRARRLAPALLLLLLTVGLARIAVPHDDSGTWRAEMLAALTYTTNWFEILTGGDYFAEFGAAQPLVHTWSLAIEEQFYVAFALLMALVLKRAQKPTTLAVLVLLAVGSAVWMAAVATASPLLAYYGTTTRIQALLVGACLAVLSRSSWASGVLGTRRRGSGQAVSLFAALLLCGMFVIPPSIDLMYRGGFFVAAIATALVIQGVISGTVLATALSWRPLVALGTVSYGVYLWHWPIYLMLGTEEPGAGFLSQLWAFVLTIFVAALSFVALERPIRKGRFVRLGPAKQWGAYGAVASVVVVLALLPGRVSPSVSAMTWPPGSEVPRRIMVAGDSTMITLEKHFPFDRYPDTVVGGPLALGCGIVDRPFLRDGVVQDPVKCRGWRDSWRSRSSLNGG